MENLSFEFNLGGNMQTALKGIQNSLAGMVNVLESATADLKDFDKASFDNLKKSVSQTCSSIDQIGQGFTEAEQKATGLNKTNLSSVSRTADNVSQSVGDIGNEAIESAANLKRINSSGMSSVSSAANNAASAVDELGDEAVEANNKLSQMDDVAKKIEGTFSGLKSTIAGAVTAFVSIEGLKSAINLSDEMTQTTSRLNLMNDGLQTTEELQQQIKQAALSSHAEYSTLADTVAKLGNNAGAAFSSSSEIVTFAEQLSKQFALSGASAEEMAAATLQLTQGLGSGVLRGDEFNSVMEQAPGIAQMIADYLEVDKSKIRDLAGEGALTADVVKNAIIGATDETNRKFDQMRVTFGQLWTDFKTNAMFAFTPISDALSNVANNPAFQNAINNLGELIGRLGTNAAPIITALGNAFVTGFDWIVNNWQTIATGIGAISSAILSFKAAQGVTSIFNTVSSGFASMMANAGENATVLSAIGKAILGLINPATLAVAGIIALTGATAALMASGKDVNDVMEGFASFDQKIAEFGNGFGDKINSFVSDLQNNLPQIAAQAGQIMSALVSGILNSGVNLIGTGLQLALQLVTGLAQAMPTIVSSGFTFVTNFLSGLMQALPQIANTALTVIENFIGSLAQNLPTLIQSGVETIAAWLQGMQQMKATLFTRAIEMISGFAQTLGDHLPELITKGFELITSLVTGILQALPTIAQTALSLIINFGGYILQNLPTIIQAGINIVGAIVTGLWNSIPALFSGVAHLLGAVIDGIAQAVPNIITAAWDMGKQLVQGLWDGISGAWSGFWTWVGEQFNSIIDHVKSIFGIASPSTIFKDIGFNLLQGFWDGLKNVWDNLSSWIGGVWDSITSLFSGGNDATPEIDYSETIAQTQAQLDQLTQSVQQAFAQINAQAAALNQQLAAQTVATYYSMIPQIVAAVSQLTQSINAEVNQINIGFATVFQGLSGQALNYLANLRSMVIGQISQIVTQMGQSFAALTGTFAGIFTQIGSLSSSLLLSFNQSAISILGSLVSTIAGIIQQLVTDFSSVFSQIVSVSISSINMLYKQSVDAMSATRSAAIAEISIMGSTVIGLFSNLAASSIASVKTMANTVINSLSNLTANSITIIAAFSSTIQSVFSEMSSRLIATVQALSISIQQLIQSMVDNVVRIARTLVTQFGSIGNDMMVQLKNGIQSQMGSVTSLTSELVEKLKQTFITGLGIHSPSKFMEYIGQMMLAGLMSGMSSSQIAGFVQSTIESMKNSFKNGQFNADELVNYLGQDSLSVIKYLEVIGDQTVSELFNDGGVPPIVQEALKYVGYAPGGGNSIMGARYGNPGAWCASFVRYCAENVGVYFPPTNYVPDVLEWSIANGRYTQTPQPGYAAIFGGGSHIELVAGVSGGTVDMVGGNTGAGEVKHRPRSDATSYVILDGGHSTLTLKDTIMQAYNAKYNPAALMLGSGAGYNPSAGVEQWRSSVQQVLQMLGQPLSLVDAVLYAIQCESSGNPNAINLTDSNAAAGHPSQGLLQTIPSTFAAYRNPSLPNDITNPLANIYAGLNYMIQRYGSVANVVNPRLGGWYGYDVGTRYVPQDMAAIIHKGEAIIPAGQNPYSRSGGDYLGDLFDNVQSRYSATAEMQGSGSNSYVNITVDFNNTQYIQAGADSGQVADEVLDKLYDGLMEQYQAVGGGISADY